MTKDSLDCRSKLGLTNNTRKKDSTTFFPRTDSEFNLRRSRFSSSPALSNHQNEISRSNLRTSRSDTILYSRNYHESIQSFAPSLNQTFSIVQRSEAASVKATVASIQHCVQNHETRSSRKTPCNSDDETFVPVKECDSVACYTQDPYYIVVVTSVGGISIVLAAMHTYPDSEYLQERACVTLGNLSRNNKNNQQEIQKRGGLLLIISAMRTHVKSPRLQSSAADALMYSTSIVNKGWCVLEEEIDDFPNLLRDMSNNTFLCLASRTKLDVLHQNYTESKLR